MEEGLRKKAYGRRPSEKVLRKKAYGIRLWKKSYGRRPTDKRTTYCYINGTKGQYDNWTILYSTVDNSTKEQNDKRKI